MISATQIPNEIDSNPPVDKDQKYHKFYEPNDLFWGIGIENETYFMTEKPTQRSGSYAKRNRRRERYSVDYNTSYHLDALDAYLTTIFQDNDIYEFPVYVNAHTFTRTDNKGEHITLYTYGKKYNTKFNGKTLDNLLRGQTGEENRDPNLPKIEFTADPPFDDMFVTDFEHNYLYDGDTIEFITQKFYKGTTDQIIDELTTFKNRFINKLNEFLAKHKLPKMLFPQVNYGMIQFRTNPNNINTFNNGTYHINLTMPTKLNAEGKIEDLIRFEAEHQNAIRLIQWVEPLIMALYGSPDVFSFLSDNRYVAGSLRVTASRYISASTYNPDTMIRGKQLNDPQESMFIVNKEDSWYNRIYKDTGYKQTTIMGYDINYAKHYNSGIEFRILDYFPEGALRDIVNFLILILDASLHIQIQTNAEKAEEWNDLMYETMMHGYLSTVSPKSALALHTVCGFPNILTSKSLSINDYMRILTDYLWETHRNGYCSSRFSPNMPKPTLHNINRYMWEHNYLQYIPINNSSHIRVTKLFNIYERFSELTATELSQDDQRLYHLILSLSLDQQPGLDLDRFYDVVRNSKKLLTVDKYVLF